MSRFGEEEEKRNGGRIRKRWSLRSHILLVQYRLFDWEPVAGRARKNGRWFSNHLNHGEIFGLLGVGSWVLLHHAVSGVGGGVEVEMACGLLG